MLLYHSAPRRNWRLHSYAQERKSGLDEYGRGKIGGGDDDKRAHYVGQYMAEKYAEVGIAESLARLHKFFVSQAHNLSSHHACYLYPHCKSHGHKHLPKTAPQSHGYGNDEEQGGNAPNHIDKPHYQVINLATEKAGNKTQRYADNQGNEHGDKSHRKTDAAAYEQLTQHIATKAVGAEQITTLFNEIIFYHACQLRYAFCNFITIDSAEFQIITFLYYTFYFNRKGYVGKIKFLNLTFVGIHAGV